MFRNLFVEDGKDSIQRDPAAACFFRPQISTPSITMAAVG
jgi:hypothetical protein